KLRHGLGRGKSWHRKRRFEAAAHHDRRTAERGSTSPRTSAGAAARRNGQETDDRTKGPKEQGERFLAHTNVPPSRAQDSAWPGNESDGGLVVEQTLRGSATLVGCRGLPWPARASLDQAER